MEALQLMVCGVLQELHSCKSSSAISQRRAVLQVIFLFTDIATGDQPEDHQYPEPAKTLRATSFARVLHDSASARELHAELDALQGHVPGLFFCGAYSVPGMGLLEEGTKSGKKAARMALEAMRA